MLLPFFCFRFDWFTSACFDVLLFRVRNFFVVMPLHPACCHSNCEIILAMSFRHEFQREFRSFIGPHLNKRPVERTRNPMVKSSNTPFELCPSMLTCPHLFRIGFVPKARATDQSPKANPKPSSTVTRVTCCSFQSWVQVPGQSAGLNRP